MKATPSDLLAMPCLMQSRRLLVFTARDLAQAQFVVYQGSLILQGSFPASQSPACTDAWCFFFGCKTLYFPLLNFTRLILPFIIAINKSMKLISLKSSQWIGMAKLLQRAIHPSIAPSNVWQKGTHLSPHPWSVTDWRVFYVSYMLNMFACFTKIHS